MASRYAPSAGEIGLRPHRRLLSRGASLFFRLFFPIRGVRDYSSGFRAYRVGLHRRAAARWGSLVTADGFEANAEILAKLSRLRPRPRAAEFPLRLRYDLKRSPSKMRIVPTLCGYLGLFRKVAYYR